MTLTPIPAPEEPEPSLTQLADEIRADIEKADEYWGSALQCALDAGEKLNRAKSRVKHGEWLPWLKGNGIAERTARTYMELARNRLRVADLRSVRQAVAMLAESKSPETEDWEIVETEPQPFTGGLAESPEETAARYTPPGEGVRYKEIPLMYPLDQYEEFVSYLWVLQRAWRLEDVRAPVFEAVKRAAAAVNGS